MNLGVVIWFLREVLCELACILEILSHSQRRWKVGFQILIRFLYLSKWRLSLLSHASLNTRFVMIVLVFYNPDWTRPRRQTMLYRVYWCSVLGFWFLCWISNWTAWLNYWEVINLQIVLGALLGVALEFLRWLLLDQLLPPFFNTLV